jgi:lactate permease
MLSVLIPGYLMVVMVQRRKAMQVLPAIIACGVSFAGVQFYVSNYVGPELTDILSSLTCIAVMVVFLKVWKPKEIMHLEGEQVATFAAKKHAPGQIFMAWLPYMLLVIAVLTVGAPNIKARINTWTDGLMPDSVRAEPITHPTPAARLNRIGVPGLHNLITQVPPVVPQKTPYGALFELNWLTASGTACFLATIAAALFLGVGPRRFAGIYVATFRQLSFALITIAAMLGLAYLMNYSGMTSTLGLSLAASGGAFPFFSAFVGWLGVFLTGSDTSANALFGNLQVVTANALHLNPVLTASVNSAAGVMGKMISIQSIAVAVAATGMTRADESRLFRFTIKHSILLMVVMGLLSMMFAYVLPDYVPMIAPK